MLGTPLQRPFDEGEEQTGPEPASSLSRANGERGDVGVLLDEQQPAVGQDVPFRALDNEVASIIPPQLGIGGGTPRPRKLNAPSATIITPTSSIP